MKKNEISMALRKKVEMPQAQPKRIPGLGRLRLRGPCGANDEFLLAATAQKNLAKRRGSLFNAANENSLTSKTAAFSIGHYVLRSQHIVFPQNDRRADVCKIRDYDRVRDEADLQLSSISNHSYSQMR
ncbi:hypothetical protein [Silicimonas sp. MF1-12-2]|uniref:hypothetical protein n=1 Tax=Silicimonas sp. MF1-12-2 TaxID=3384793 RepID=UPI0039B3C453